ncbi:phospholipid/cholesterol/gamma-HCH transport system substrate-binding protein [Achromobacter deleyi]|uniref:MlaD family protein n=1 Tax=Achromobacter TaxID=222 RepID=UPI0018EC3519|nr:MULTISPECIES: MlaD family protein [Achromobacter]MDR6604482.1 phospholipid/cholesterol/gamma-HCH transport system substrate-binding protein [Achromobacter deleyi]
MENRSHALMAGIFTLVLLAAAALVAVWIGRDRTKLQTYEIVSATAVSGLNPQSAVRYQGVPVGKVQSLALNPNKPGQVRIRIGVAPNTPITESTWAELGVQGVTGMANVELRDDGTSLKRLASSAEHPAAIPLRPGFLDRIEQRGGKLISNVEEVTEQLRRVLSEQNVQALTASLQNATDLTQSLKEASRGLAPAMAKLGPLMESLGNTSRQADRAAREIADLAQQSRQALARLNAPDGPLSVATRSLNDIALAAARLDGETLPAVTNMAANVSAAARGATITLRRVDSTPQSFLFGPAPIAPGPGEAGFAGFGRQPK